MKVKTVTIGMAYTFQIEQYHPIRGEYSLEVELTDDETLEDVEEMVRSQVKEGLKEALGEVAEIHNNLSSGLVEEVLGLEDDNGSLEEDDDDDMWED